jgi:hypothetical protein
MFRHTGYLHFDAKPEKPDPEPLGGPGSAPAPDPKLCRASLPARPSAPKPAWPEDQGRLHLIGSRKPAVTGSAAGPHDGACRKE